MSKVLYDERTVIFPKDGMTVEELAKKELRDVVVMVTKGDPDCHIRLNLDLVPAGDGSAHLHIRIEDPHAISWKSVLGITLALTFFVWVFYYR